MVKQPLNTNKIHIYTLCNLYADIYTMYMLNVYSDIYAAYTLNVYTAVYTIYLLNIYNVIYAKKLVRKLVCKLNFCFILWIINDWFYV